MKNIRFLILRFNPAVNKRLLLIIAGSFWLSVSIKILLMAIQYLHSINQQIVYYILFSLPSYSLFFYFVFFRLIKKHTNRIIHKNEKACIFGFFDFKSYALMLIMIIMGIIVIKFVHLPAISLAIFFTALGLSMFSSSIYFFYYAIKYRYTIQKFKNQIIN